MIFSQPCCPECHEFARGTLESVPGLALLRFIKDGEAEYEGETEMFWNNQRTIRADKGQVTLICPNHHEWKSDCHE